MPLIEGQLSRFRVYGLYRGLMVMEDLPTGSVWRHLSGDCIYGPLAGAQLEVIGPVLHMTAGQVINQYPQAHIAISRQNLFLRLYGRLITKVVSGRRGFIPPPFYRTMLPADGRLPRLAMGLGVWDDSLARFYPLTVFQSGPVFDTWHGRDLHLHLNPQTKTPQATFKTTPAEKPLQTFTRWYGFIATFPHCQIYQQETGPEGNIIY